jgi:predicted enzyme related to lactoylglutathione lyase
MPDPVVHFEIAGPDPVRLAAFYGRLFGWSITPGTFGNYYNIAPAVPGGLPGGIRQETFTERVFYVKVPDLHAAVKRAEDLGGRVVIPPKLVPGVVHFAMIEDPAGNRAGLVQS